MALQKKRELTEIRIRFQHNGEGAVYFSHVERVRDGEQVFNAGEEHRAGIRFEDFRGASIPVTLQSGERVHITGSDFESICMSVGAEMENQAAGREKRKRDADAALKVATDLHAAEVAKIERDGAGKAKRE